MEFNKCSRCGSFYVSKEDVCPKCSPKDGFEFQAFKSYIEKNGCEHSLAAISGETGISTKNLNRFLQKDELQSFSKDFRNIENSKEFGNDGVFFQG